MPLVCRAREAPPPPPPARGVGRRVNFTMPHLVKGDICVVTAATDTQDINGVDVVCQQQRRHQQ